jgi:hypothetical protein
MNGHGAAAAAARPQRSILPNAVSQPQHTPITARAPSISHPSSPARASQNLDKNHALALQIIKIHAIWTLFFSINNCLIQKLADKLIFIDVFDAESAD